MGETDSEAPTVEGRTLEQVRMGDGVRRFQHNILGKIAENQNVPIEQVVQDTLAWVKKNPNQNDTPVREYRHTRRAGQRDALMHAAVLKKQGNVDRGMMTASGVDVGIYNKKRSDWDRIRVTLETKPQEEAIPTMPDVPAWVNT